MDFLVMEYLDGETLAERLAKGPLPLDHALQYAIQIADALDKAHRQGITRSQARGGRCGSRRLAEITRGGAATATKSSSSRETR
jgi:hypothetical protein